RGDGRLESTQFKAWRYAFHDSIGGVGRVAGTVVRPGRFADWNSCGQSRPGGDCEPDRVLRQHRRIESGYLGITNAGNITGSGEEAGDCRPAASGDSLRTG